MIALACISGVGVAIGLVASGLRVKIWAVLVMSFAIVAVVAAFAYGGHLSPGSAIALAFLALGALQAGYLAGGLYSLAASEREARRSPGVSSRVRAPGATSRNDVEKTY